VPVQCEFFGIQALAGIYQEVLASMQAAELTHAKLEGIVLTMYDGRTRMARSVIEEVRTHFPNETYKTIIPRTVRLGEAPSHSKTIIEYDSAGVGAFAYRALADEFVQRRREYRVT
jgi:chromosome partitioning protein